ncbi:diphosphomevalonate decarboxylase [candidate division KSB1 bacterium]|nr:diphosphomevalonate decarboxylase [candidate division KSB1 bacterium]RQW00629.1 MAG: diphosphomevalonate decarboxylase [candidate division KSB1 bacterium]
MTKQQVVQKLTGAPRAPRKTFGKAFAPSNIALCKYWGKRNAELNLPINSSLSISLGHLGTETVISQNESSDDMWLNDRHLDADETFAKRLIAYLNLFRPSPDFFFKISTTNNFPTAAGLASSASGYAALILALDDFFDWNLEGKALSILARLGSGSASRSVYQGFVQWYRGASDDGMDSYAEQLPEVWPELRLAVLTVSHATKPVSSTEGMQKTVETSTLYKSWPEKAERDLDLLRTAIQYKYFEQLGSVAESNALAMHATMIDTSPPVLYWLPETVAIFRKIWHLRRQGEQLYFTIDAGPNVKLLYEKPDEKMIQNHFPHAEIINPFGGI